MQLRHDSQKILHSTWNRYSLENCNPKVKTTGQFRRHTIRNGNNHGLQPSIAQDKHFHALTKRNIYGIRVLCIVACKWFWAQWELLSVKWLDSHVKFSATFHVSVQKWSVQTLSDITKTRLYNFDHLKSHLYIVKLWFIGVYIIVFLFLLKNKDCGYSLEPPRRDGSNEYPQSMFLVEIWELPEFFIWKFFSGGKILNVFE